MWCFSRNGDFNFIYGLGVSRNYFHKWAPIDVPFRLWKGLLVFRADYDIVGHMFQLTHVRGSFPTRIIFAADHHKLYNSSPVPDYIL